MKQHTLLPGATWAAWGYQAGDGKSWIPDYQGYLGLAGLPGFTRLATANPGFQAIWAYQALPRLPRATKLVTANRVFQAIWGCLMGKTFFLSTRPPIKSSLWHSALKAAVLTN